MENPVSSNIIGLQYDPKLWDNIRRNLDDIKKVRSRVHSRVCSTVKVSVQAKFWNKLWNELWNELWNILFLCRLNGA